MENTIDQYPAYHTPHIKMSEANEIIDIYDGDFKLIADGSELLVYGRIYFEWFPEMGAKFSSSCKIIDDKKVADISETDRLKMWFKLNANNSAKLYVNELVFGDVYIYPSITDDFYINGEAIGEAVLGDKSIAATELKFVVPNFREFAGSTTVEVEGGHVQYASNRLSFEDEDYVILLDKLNNFKQLKESLDAKGGYIILYSGILKRKDLTKGIEYSKIIEVFHCFSKFLTFINGRRTSTLFIQGLYNDEVLWTDYSEYQVDMKKFVLTWSQRHSIVGFNNIWGNFKNIWFKEKDKDFLVTVIHWYVESIANSAFVEGSIIMTQVALELVYNWFLIEKVQLITGKDAENISASNKIRLLLSQMSVKSVIPAAFIDLEKLKNNETPDGPEVFVQIRNALIHSQEEKRKKLSKINYTAIGQALQLGILYLELSLLYILKFDGKYFNRCSGATWEGQGEEFVPWKR